MQSLYSKIDTSKLATGVVLRTRILYRLRRDTAFSPESMLGSPEAEFNGRRGAVRRWGFGASCGLKVSG